MILKETKPSSPRAGLKSHVAQPRPNRYAARGAVFKFVSLFSLMKVLRNPSLGEKWLSFAFDDGLEEAGTAASEVLEKFHYRGSFYVVTGWVEPATVAD